MPKIRKVQRRKTYKVNINRKRLRNKMRKLPDIACPQVKAAWENSKSTRMNLLQMGLSYDPNKSLKIPNMKTEMVKNAARLTKGELIGSDGNKNKPNRLPKKIQVAMSLEEDAKAPRESTFRLPNGQVQFVTYLMDKYGDDYKAMARDKKNYYQLTWRQIRSRINTFKGIPEQYAEYLLNKGEIVLDDPEPLKETMKKIAEEKVKKHCAPKKPKKQKQTVSQWIEESIDDEGKDVFDTMDTLQDEESDSEEKLPKEKKLELFSDDESDQYEDKMMDSKTKNKQKTKISVKQKQPKTMMECEQSSDIESDLEHDNDCDDGDVGFKHLDSMSDEDLSDDDMLDDDGFVTDSE